MHELGLAIEVVEWLPSGSDAGLVRVNAPNGRFLARAFYSDRSQITLRILTRHDVPVDRAFWRSRLEQAMSFRERLDIDATAYRLVHGEAAVRDDARDLARGLPGNAALLA